MLNIWKNSILILLSSMFFVMASSCSKENEDEPSTYVKPLVLSTNEISFDCVGGTRIVTIQSGSVGVSIHISDSWLSLNQNRTTLNISAKPNNQKNARTAIIELSDSYGNYAKIDVKQHGTNASDGDDDDPSEETQLPAPTNVKAEQVGNSIIVTWNAVKGASRYEVFHSSSANGKYGSCGYWTNNIYEDDVVIGKDNYYKIKAVGATTSEFSDYAYCQYTTGGGTKKPAVPTGLSAKQVDQTIVVSWNSVSNVYYYRLWYSTPSGKEDFTNIYAPTTQTVFENNMKDGTYKFWIQSVNSDYEDSDKSSIITCTFKSSGGGGGGGNTTKKLETPKNIEAYSDTYYVQVSCDEVPLAYEYELYRSTSPNSGYSKINASGGSTAGGRYVLTDSSPKSGTTYYKIKAKSLSYLGIADSDLSSYVKVVR